VLSEPGETFFSYTYPRRSFSLLHSCLGITVKVFSCDLFTNDILCLFVGPQSQKDRLAQLVVVRPLGKFDQGDKHRFKPLAPFHDRWRNLEAPSAFGFFWQIYKRTGRHPVLLKLCIETRQELVGKTSADSAGGHKPGPVLGSQRAGNQSIAGFGCLLVVPFLKRSSKSRTNRRDFFSPYWGSSLSGWVLPRIVLTKCTKFQMCSSDSTLPNAGIPLKRIPFFTIRNNSGSE
jgi:hypothetical protein